MLAQALERHETHGKPGRTEGSERASKGLEF